MWTEREFEMDGGPTPRLLISVGLQAGRNALRLHAERPFPESGDYASVTAPDSAKIRLSLEPA